MRGLLNQLQYRAADAQNHGSANTEEQLNSERRSDIGIETQIDIKKGNEP
jgi:hypothetical protein